MIPSRRASAIARSNWLEELVQVAPLPTSFGLQCCHRWRVSAHAQTADTVESRCQRQLDLPEVGSLPTGRGIMCDKRMLRVGHPERNTVRKGHTNTKENVPRNICIERLAHFVVVSRSSYMRSLWFGIFFFANHKQFILKEKTDLYS